MTDTEYKIRAELANIYESNINAVFDNYIKKHKGDIRYFIHYPLIDIEIGFDNGDVVSIDNCVNSDSFGLLVKKTQNIWSYMESKKRISTVGFIEYTNKNKNNLKNAWYNTQTLNSIKDSTSFAKSEIVMCDEKEYKFISSTVTNKFKEENFYYFGEDNREAYDKERETILKNILKICIKYRFNIKKIQELETDIDSEIMDYAKEKIMMDLTKLHPKTSSKIFKNIKNLSFVLSYLYYLAFIRKLLIDQKKTLGIKIQYDEYLLKLDKELLIEKITSYFNANKYLVTNIINYLINTGYENISEFPLYEHHNILFTVPSLIMLNDWSFTLVNGHYIKGINFVRREKTISVSTECKLEQTLIKTDNIIFAKEKCYSFIDEYGKSQDSDIDFAILDVERKKLLVIESKWKDNHYKNNEKNYIKIEDTLNKIYKNQISKHQKFLSSDENLKLLFNDQINLKIDELDIFYIAVDKRNQLHLNNHHMLTEYILLWLINKNINDKKLNLENVFNEIKNLNTVTEYIFTEPVHKIKLTDDTIIEIDDVDFFK